MRNTEHDSNERIWIQSTYAEFYFSHDDKTQRCNPLKIAAFLTDAHEAATKAGYVDILVEPYSSTDEWGNRTTCYLQVRGWREETDKEYKNRLSLMIIREERDKSDWELKRKYYEMKPNDDTASLHSIKLNRMKSAMKEINK